ncbi:uncharacterized protein K452DRAFT_299647 [Aplosporella prunicola CBS 121167]|uniref:F-box domain-containing protein n=1 Tax=Aplosporella prunicola CBS 121167 TaxID=1176127 RepID=A0A6A6BA82_9PEZI|nr:uncharacterized protein K452DRAFT_299647 [Aplosporella prunicola CBS 121167]KAF2140283.1 hypothetical protein K452DRAFT_299647 [Aplosporella prunicola CBS 121167]
MTGKRSALDAADMPPRGKRPRTGAEQALATNTKSQGFPLLELPPELRNIIYKMVLHTERVNVSMLKPANVHRIHVKPSTRLNPNLLLVNKQIHSEAGSFLYSNDFWFDETRSLVVFLFQLKPGTRSWITSISIHKFKTNNFTKVNNYNAFCLLAESMKLRHLNIPNAFSDETGAISQTKVNTDIFRDASSWIKSVGNLHGNKYAALGIISIRPASQDPLSGWPPVKAWLLEDKESTILNYNFRHCLKEALDKNDDKGGPH